MVSQEARTVQGGEKRKGTWGQGPVLREGHSTEFQGPAEGHRLLANRVPSFERSPGWDSSKGLPDFHVALLEFPPNRA